MRGLAVLCDFDGTIAKIDTAEFALRRFANGNWKKYEEQLDEGKITLEECMEREFALVKVSKAEIVSEVGRAATLRPGFSKLVNYCEVRHIPLVIVSAGLDFVVREILRRSGWEDRLEIRVPRSRVTSEGIRFLFPELKFDSSQNFKDDTVAYYHRLGRHVAYVGDGSPDFVAVKAADLAFTVRGSKLSTLCDKKGIPHKDIADFTDVVQGLELFRKTITHGA
jgi:HAD superfamily phosphoserine phosphatase-like hydrolase